MNIENGLFEHMVLQRNQAGVSDGKVTGVCRAAGVVCARVTHGAKVVKGLNWAKVGKAAAGRFAARLPGIPTGGPYRIDLQIQDRAGQVLETVKVADVLVGDVWILAGQSNMEGVGLLHEAQQPSRGVRCFYMTDQWRVAKDPVHTLWCAVDEVHTGPTGPVAGDPNRQWGVGPGVAFGVHMEKFSGIPQGLIACAHGGTSMAQWSPALKDQGGKSLYGAMLRRFNKNGQKVAGMVWYQGCSDASPEAAPIYTQKMQEFVRAVRQDLHHPSLPIVAVQISRVVGWGSAAAHWNSIQDQQRRLSESIRNLLVVPAIDLDLVDPIHIAGKDQNRLGRRLAEAMWVLHGQVKKLPPPIVVRKISVQTNPVSGLADIVVEYANVVGKLQAGGRPAGFEIVGTDAFTPRIFRIDLEKNRAILHAIMSPYDVAAYQLYYGFGLAPYCNITDQADRSLPVFGPLPVGKLRAMTPFARAISVSAFQPSAGKLHDLACPPDLAVLELTPRTFPTDFSNLHEEIMAGSQPDAVVYYACRVQCSEPMKLAAWLGYDGPVKLWVDGRQIYHDPNGTNPAQPGKSQTRFAAGAGEHTVLVALATNNRAAWGIFLRFERLDVAQSKIKLGQGSYTMPTISPF